MASTGNTPIQLYYSNTAGNIPPAANLIIGELAINVPDGKLFYKDNAGSVLIIASNSTVQTAQLALFNANLAYTQANSAYNLANSGVAATSAFTQANLAFLTANNAWNTANTAYNVANNAWAGANASYTYASSTANNAYNTANAAWSTANSKFNSSGGSISGPVTINSTLTVTGNVTLSGNVTTVSANNLAIQDNMIYLNSGSNVANPDLGFAGNYNDGIYHHAGFFRKASDGIWRVFDNYLPEPDASPYIDTSNSTFRIADFQANTVYANTLIISSNTLIANLNASLLGSQPRSYYENLSIAAYVTANSGYAAANTANGTANIALITAQAAFNKANTGGSGSSSGYLPNAIIFANTSGYLSNVSNLQFTNSNTLSVIGTITTNTINASQFFITGTGTPTYTSSGDFIFNPGPYGSLIVNGSIQSTNVVITKTLNLNSSVNSTPSIYSFGNIVVADGINWNPMNFTANVPYPVFYNGNTWTGLGGATTTITDDNTTNATRYVMLGSTTTGYYNNANTSSSKLRFNPNTGILFSNNITTNSLIVSNTSISLGLSSYTNQGTYIVSIGNNAGSSGQNTNSVAIGSGAGQISQRSYATAVGAQAGQSAQGTQAIAFGFNSGNYLQGTYSVAVGSNAGQNNQGAGGVAVGFDSGQTSQGTAAVSVGYYAGQSSQNSYSVAIGPSAGAVGQGTESVAIGDAAGYQGQGQYAVAIGQGAGYTNQPSYSIFLNASQYTLSGVNSGLYINPIRSDNANSVYNVFYNTSTKEVTYSNNYILYANYTPPTTTGSAIQITASNTKGGTGYADALQITNTSGGATNPNKYIRLTSIGELQVVNSTYQTTTLSLTDGGDLTLSGNTTINGISPNYAPNRPAFRVTGNGGSISATTTVAGGYMVVDFNQGSYLNTSTGYFTAPVAGLYQVNVVVRTQSNSNSGINQIIIRKTTAIGGTVTSIIMVEFGPNTSMNHTGGSTIIKLAVGDTLKFDVTAGTISFDGNDNWSVAYIG